MKTALILVFLMFSFSSSSIAKADDSDEFLMEIDGELRKCFWNGGILRCP